MNLVDKSTIAVRSIIAPAAAKTASFNSAVIDTTGFEELTIAVNAGALADGSWASALKYSDLPLSGGDLDSPQVVPADDIIGVQPAFAAADDNAVRIFSVKVLHKYYRLDFTGTGLTSGGFLGGVAILGGAKYKPVQ